MLNFIIPIRHPQSVPDWSIIESLLPQTFRSIAAQDSDEWQAVVVANVEADLPVLPDRFRVVRVDLPLNKLPEQADNKDVFYNAVRDDKGARVYAGAVTLQPGGHIMVVDYDDLVSRRLASMVAAHPHAPGWYVQHGYRFDDGRFMSRLDDFHESCGTSLIIRHDLFAHVGSETHSDYVRYVLGSHKFIRQRLIDQSVPLAAISWPAACYRVGHAHSTDRTSSVLAGLSARSLVLNPKKTLALLAKLQPVTPSLRREFYG